MTAEEPLPVRRRRLILTSAALLATVAALLPPTIALVWAWYRALDAEQQRLEELVARAVVRGHGIVAQVDSTLATLRRSPFDICSERAVADMRARTIATRDIDEIGRYRDHRIVCNSWGVTDWPITLAPAVSPSSSPSSCAASSTTLCLSVASSSAANPDKRLIGLHDRGLYAYIEPGRFADIALANDTQLGVFTHDGQLVASRGDTAQLQEVVARMDLGRGQAWERLFVARTEGMFKIVVSAPLRGLAMDAVRRKLQWVPPALLLSLLGLGAVGAWARRGLSMQGELRAALRRGQLEVHYQPIIALASGRCVGAEAMARWHHPIKGWITPDVFIVLAEQHGLVQHISRYVIQTLLSELGPFLRTCPELHIAFNLSSQDMHGDGVLAQLPELLAQHGVAPAQIWLELTERALTDVGAARAVLEPLRQRGHRIAIDDFGTGYSSLSYLQSLPLDVLKIDKSFVDTVGHDEVAHCVIRHIIGMATALQLEIVAEGIEQHAQADWLRAHQVQYGQGWLYARAMPAAQFIAYCAGRPSMVGDPGQDQGHRGQ